MTVHRMRSKPLGVRRRVDRRAAIIRCALTSHPWGRWRRETEEWFEYVDAPVKYAWRVCRRCRLMENIR